MNDSFLLKSTSKGQVTLPKKWRDQFETDTFLGKVKDFKITIIPIDTNELEEEVVFDADRDNEGKGLDPKKIIKLLKKIKNG